MASLTYFCYNYTMTATEKYLTMNNEFCKLRDAIYESNVVEADEDENVQKTISNDSCQIS